MVYALYNPYAGNNTGLAKAERVKAFYPDVNLIDLTKITSYADFLAKLTADDRFILCGGDGTLNRFVNETYEYEYPVPIFYFPAGSGNDFACDFGKKDGDEPFEITKYLKNLPTVTVKDKSYKFINGVGYGIDGYCCEVGDKLRAEGTEKINYAGIAIKGLLFHYKPTQAKVTVDGQIFTYKKAWLAPTMNGRFYGGGMNATPNQDRNNNQTLSCMLMHDAGKLHTLAVFPSIFKGEHVKHEKMVAVHVGKQITVEFDRPVALQVDGETILGVTTYTAIAPEA